MELNSIFRDGMVLAADKPIRVFGQGQGRVTVRFLGETVTAVSHASKWCVFTHSHILLFIYSFEHLLNSITMLGSGIK